MTVPGPLAIAHRAGNSVGSLRAAEAARADVVEADVWRYRGTLEVRHLKTMGHIPLLWDRWKLVRASAPRLSLSGLLAAAAPETHFMFDLKGKDPALPGDLVAAVEASGREASFTVCSQSWDLLEHFRDFPEVRVAHSVGGPIQLRRVWERLTWHDRHVISIHYKLLSAEKVRMLKERTSGVITWPINTRERLESVIEWGVDGFTSDSLELVREYVAGRERRD